MRNVGREKHAGKETRGDRGENVKIHMWSDRKATLGMRIREPTKVCEVMRKIQESLLR